LALAKGLISGNIAKNILLITSETYSKFVHPKDKSNKTIFGDGASATLVSANEGFAEIFDFVLGTDGGGAENLIVKNGGCKNPTLSGIHQESAVYGICHTKSQCAGASYVGGGFFVSRR
jgi:3-oxoacyl-[acyl-carrier-protein] synthase-3